MLWKNRRESTNVEDRRGIGAPHVAVGGGLGTIVIVLILSLLFHVNPLSLLSEMSGGDGSGTLSSSQPASPHEQELTHFVLTVLASTEDVWGEQFGAIGRQYEPPKLVLFSGQVDSACGYASAAVGPFYCPGDRNVYLDLSFFDELQQRFGAPGDFAEAYVIAHEVGHHVQQQLGISDKVARLQAGASKKQLSDLSVRQELQADFYAGVWAHYAAQTPGFIEPGDIDEGLQAASAIGDDRLQMEAQGYVVPDSFTHGTSEQRVRWFRSGFDSGDIKQGDTFSAKSL